MLRVSVDAYVLDSLMADLVGHDRRPSAFIVYLLLWRKTNGGTRDVGLSLRMIADGTGLSLRAAQDAIQVLVRRQLLEARRKRITSIAMYTLHCPWRARAAR